MTNPTLKSPDESVPHLAKVFDHGGMFAHLEVHEDRCFKSDNWLRVGTIRIYPLKDEQQDTDSPTEQAIRLGSYSWQVPKFEAITENIQAIYRQAKKRDEKQKIGHIDKTRRALESLFDCATRCGFVNPTFDAGSVSEMPFVRPTTVVVDTTAILKGGLDFVIRFLYPMARIKIPAIAHMEILNMAERYMSHRRTQESELRVASAMYDHVTGQGGQRVLLRLELQTEAEIERPRLGADPLRGIVQPDHDQEDKNLGLMQVVRSFADRLILETAIHHRDRLSPDHPIVVLTADQGLARMTLGEGLHALFFSSPPVNQICGRTLTGTTFRPFVDDSGETPLFHIPLPSLLWELACTVGGARVITEDRSAQLTVSAIGDLLSWHPFHSHDDLLWTSYNASAKVAQTTQTVVKPSDGPNSQRPKNTLAIDERPKIVNATPVKPPPKTGPQVRMRASGELTGSYRFPVNSMIHLILALERREHLPDREGMKIVGLATAKRYRDFRNFLLAGGFVSRDSDGIKRLPPLDELTNAVRSSDLNRLKAEFSRVPSFIAFISELAVSRPVPTDMIRGVSRTAVPTYTALAEVSCAALDITGEGIYLTPHSPPPADFAPMALDAYRRLKGSEDYVLTGKWLEELARHYGIHPVRARERLNEARAAKLLERYTEGSTPETQFERHSMSILEITKGVASVRHLNLYHGDFLIPGKASVSIRLEEQEK